MSTTNTPAPLWPLVAARPLPRLHVLSDLHLESGPYEIPADLQYDILVAAGDIGPLEISVPWLAKQGKPVVYVLGNHEHWGADIEEIVARAKELARGTTVHVLNRESVVIEGVRFLGCTLWTDLRGFESSFVATTARMMRDYEHVTCASWLAKPTNQKKLAILGKRHKLSMPAPDEEGRLRLHPGVTYLEHQTSRQWLTRQLKRHFSGPTVVVSHHAPSDQSLLRSGISSDDLKVRRWGWRDSKPAQIAGYATSGLLQAVGSESALLWVHGHTHSGMDYLENRTRVLCNPRGHHLKPLSKEDQKGYALFGMSVTDEDIKRSQEAFAEEPYRGDGRDFEPHLVVDFEHFLARPLELACARPLEASQELAAEIENLLPHLGEGRSVPERCVGEAIEQRLKKMEAVIERLGAEVLCQLDEHYDCLGLRTIHTPRLPAAWSAFEESWRTGPEELSEFRSRLHRAVQWLGELPFLPNRSLQAWRIAAAKAVEAAGKEGFELQAYRLPPAALKRLDVRDVRLAAMNEQAQRDDPEYRVERLLDQVLNGGRGPRQWLPRVDESGRAAAYIDSAWLGLAQDAVVA